MTRRPSVPTAVRTAVSSLVRRALPAQRTRPFAVPRALAAAALASCLLAVGMPALANESAVGQVSLLIGVARVVHLDGRSEPLRRGATIQVGDRVETSANGHVHLRFIDNAAVSVRPDSVLEVQSYRYDADKPQSNEVRLRVEQGTTRSISGAATELDKSRFRLNTPIAAIGVRGTDFIVHTDAAGVRATVADGAIVVSPLSGTCAASTLGPCAGADVKVLSADMGRFVAEVRKGEHVARVVPASAGVADLAAAGAEERAAALHAAETAVRIAAQRAVDAKGIAEMRDSDRAAADVLAILTPNLDNQRNLNTSTDLSNQLVWGRWSTGGAANDEVSRPVVWARQGRETTSAYREGDAVLFRTTDPSNPDSILRNDTDASVQFRLTRAQANFETPTRTEAAKVDGTLIVDFSRRTFATALALSSQTGGSTSLALAGDVDVHGAFAVRSVDRTQFVSGVVSLDSKEVGYLFQRDVIGGLFRGKTLWGR